MVRTFFRQRMTIRPVTEICFKDWDCIVLAGPTWSYHPSGPMLDFLDRYGKQVCAGKMVIPFISCRSYWRLHYWTLKQRLQRVWRQTCSADSFSASNQRTLAIYRSGPAVAGKMGRKENSWFRKHYPTYGHSKTQVDEAKAAGRQSCPWTA